MPSCSSSTITAGVVVRVEPRLLTDATLERDNEHLAVTGVGIEFNERVVYITNGFGVIDPMAVTRAIGALEELKQVAERHDALTVDQPKTRLLTEKLKAMGLTEVLIITDQPDENLYLSSRNLPNVLVLEARHIQHAVDDLMQAVCALQHAIHRH